MKPTRFLGLVAFLGLLAGCGGSPTGVAVPRATMQASRTATTSGDLLYVSFAKRVYVYKYPSLELVETFRPPRWLGYHGASNPKNGDMCFDDYYSVHLYAHGATIPYATLSAPSESETYDCALDPVTSGVALTVEKTGAAPWVDVYRDPSGSPTSYSIPGMSYLEYLGYDAKGNLFVDGQTASGFALAELAKGENSFITLSTGSLVPYGPLEWDGKYMTITYGEAIYRFSTSGSSVEIVGKTTVKGARGISGFTIQGHDALAPANNRGSKHVKYLGVWHYPQGGKPYGKAPLEGQTRIGTVLISIAPRR